jgi:putative membrane protein
MPPAPRRLHFPVNRAHRAARRQENAMRTLASIFALSMTLAAIAAMPGDATFMHKLAQANAAEIQAGNVAASRGSTAEVREFGAMMVKDHGAASEKLMSLAKAKGVTLPTSPDSAQATELKTLQSQQGAQFDQGYLASQVQAHEDAVQLLKSEIASGTDADTKALAQELLPTVEAHLREVSRLAGKAL